MGAARLLLPASLLLLLAAVSPVRGAAASSSYGGDKVGLPLLVAFADTPGLRNTTEAFAETVAKASAGKLFVSNITYGVSPANVLAAARDGRAFGLALHGMFAPDKNGVDIKTAQYLDNNLPFTLSVTQFASLLRHTPFGRFWRQVYEPLGIRAMYVGTLVGPQVGDWYKKPIAKLSDLRGLRMRYTGGPLNTLQAEILKEVGAEPVFVPLPQAKQALANGTLDALELLGVRVDLSAKIWEAGGRYLYYPGLQGPEAAHVLIPAKIADTPELEIALQRACDEAISVNYADYFGPAAQAAVKETRKNGVRVGRYPQEVIRGLFAAYRKVMARHREEQVRRGNRLGVEVLDEYDAYVRSVSDFDIMAAPEAQILPARDHVARYVGVQVPVAQRSSVCKRR
ncbi:hypothetical protein CBR_g22989 [Chara braunii]|uniref:TRAP transporter substrate-binding protein n=1 Tax=Chara braunii TaxID=69332 RepID=A0A388L3J1_CHABU|nr:hypothetical protein CBR_g22989 [Chara braunii]|eukprot:GBG76773.1 hypothetical protein CBR_g22989 [Chara braunii]